MDNSEIERRARRLQQRIWQQRAEFWPGQETHPLEALEPSVAAHVLGIAYVEHPELKFSVPGTRYESAGVLDRSRGSIAVATRFGPEVKRFTAAHEIGHWILHPENIQMHRDVPIKGLERNVREPLEKEADHFAACFLMPRRFLARVFRAMFVTDKPFVFDESAAFYFGRQDADSLLRPEKGSLARELALARARSFNGVAFRNSLAGMFKVSNTTMALRIRELGLVKAWP